MFFRELRVPSGLIEERAQLWAADTLSNPRAQARKSRGKSKAEPARSRFTLRDLRAIERAQPNTASGRGISMTFPVPQQAPFEEEPIRDGYRAKELLLSMGYSEGQASEALSAQSFDADNAVDYINSGTQQPGDSDAASRSCIASQNCFPASTIPKEPALIETGSHTLTGLEHSSSGWRKLKSIKSTAKSNRVGKSTKKAAGPHSGPSSAASARPKREGVWRTVVKAVWVKRPRGPFVTEAEKQLIDHERVLALKHADAVKAYNERSLTGIPSQPTRDPYQLSVAAPKPHGATQSSSSSSASASSAGSGSSQSQSMSARAKQAAKMAAYRARLEREGKKDDRFTREVKEMIAGLQQHWGSGPPEWLRRRIQFVRQFRKGRERVVSILPQEAWPDIVPVPVDGPRNSTAVRERWLGPVNHQSIRLDRVSVRPKLAPRAQSEEGGSSDATLHPDARSPFAQVPAPSESLNGNPPQPAVKPAEQHRLEMEASDRDRRTLRERADKAQASPPPAPGPSPDHGPDGSAAEDSAGES